tara:strand:- start:1570 stop:1755 length:186 start_codon:yes stop_codon:yes gene_type:complete
MKKYLCIEHNETFITQAENLEEAKETALMYGGSCIRELDEEESIEHKDQNGHTYYEIKKGS